MLDGLPVESYIRQGMLLDLTSTIQPMLDSGELLDSVASSFAEDGAIAAVPTRFLLPTLWGEVSGVETLADMAAWAQENPDALPLYATDVDLLVGTFYLSCAPAWFDDAGRLDEAKIEQFLVALGDIRGSWTYEAVVQATGQDYQVRLNSEGVALEWNPYSGTDKGFVVEILSGVTMVKGLQRQRPCLLRGRDALAEINGQLHASAIEGGDFAPLPGQAQGCFVPALTLGVNKGSENTETATAFVTCALGEATQGSAFDGSAGFPVNAAALEAMLREDAAPQYTSAVSAGDISWSSEWLDQAQCDRLRGIIDELQTPVVVDFTLYQMLVDETTPFFEGDIDAAQAAQNLCDRANAYLAE